MSYFPEIVQDGLRFIIAKISDSRKEIEIRLSSDSISQNETFIFNLGGQASQISRIDFYERLKLVLDRGIEDNNSDIVVPLDDGSYIPLVNSNYFKDSLLPSNDVKKILFVIKLNKPLPPSFKKLSKISLLSVKSEIVLNEIIYGGPLEELPQKFGKSLEYDYTQNPFDNGIKETSTFQNKNELTSSLPNYRLDTISSGSNSYKKRLIDYSEFSNFVHFSSAEKRIINFKTKLQTIETHLTNISHSLVTLHQNDSEFNRHAGDIRTQNFEAVQKIINEFTDYENWLYNDNQVSTLNSAPGVGKSLTDSSASLNLSKNISQQFNKEGFDVVYVLSGSSTEKITILDDKYNLDDIHFNNSTGSFYLSFLMRASASVSDNFNHQNTLTSSVPTYPMDSLNLQTISAPSSTGSAYKRYIFAASGSHWVPTNNKTMGLNPINFGVNSPDIILTSGSGIFSKTSEGVGLYANYLTHNTGSGTTISGSFVPRGDLFNLTIAPTGDKNLSGIITDVKITTKSPYGMLPFHNLHSTDSDEFTSWYNNSISSASYYDSQNIQRLTNNIPNTYINDETTNEELIKYVDTIGEFFDEYKTFIDDYYRLFNKGYSDYQEVPSKYNKILAENLGFNLLPIQENNFLKFFGLTDNLKNSRQYSDIVMNNILNNLSYLYKTKGTRNSLNALMSCYGLPSNVLKIKEGHTHLKAYDQSFLSNDTNVSALNIFNQTGSYSHAVKSVELSSIIINDDFDTDNFKFKWNPSSAITQSTIEAIFKMPKTSNTMSLFSSYANNDSSLLWQVNMVPSTTDTKKGKFQFRLSSQANGSSDLVANSSLAETDFLNVLDNSLVNVMVQKSSSGHDISQVHTYELVVGNTTNIGGKFTFLTSSKLVVDGDSESTANKNFISGSVDKHLFIANNYTGSVSQIKSYSTPLSFTAFKQHVFNKGSIVGNNYSSSITDLQYYYPLQENYISGSSTDFKLEDASTNNKGGVVELDSNLFNSMSVVYDNTLVENISFPIFGDGSGQSNFSDNLITIEDPPLLTSNLNPNTSVLRYNNSIGEPEFNHSRELYFSRSPQEVINDFLKDNLGNADFNDLFADPRDEFKNTYSDLDKFNDDLKSYNIAVDMTRFIEATKKIFNNSFLESVKKLLPVKAKVNVGTTIKPTYTTRTKLPPLRERPSIELQVQPEGTNIGTAAGAPDFTGTELFLPPEHTFIGFGTSTSSLGSFEQTTLGFTGDDDAYNLNNITFESDIKKFPQKFWGTSSSDIHFKSAYGAGIENEFNTYHYEDRAVFTALTDPERIIHTTGSSGILNTNYATSSTFVNRRLIKLSEAVPERFLGVTQELVTTESVQEPYGKMIDSDTRIPVRHIANLQTPPYFKYTGTKLGNFRWSPSSPTQTIVNFPGRLLFDASYAFNPFGVGDNNTQEWEDLSTASFYRIELAPQNQNTLRIVKDGEQNTGNQIN